ncbi:MAG: FtsB/FtsL family cell division protein, partial [Planctomycetota bacterium]
ELETKNARLENYLAMKAQADLAGGLQVRNLSLEREVRDLKDRLGKLQEERKELYGSFADKLIDMKGGDPEAIKEMAKKLGIYKEPEPVPPRDGPFPLAGNTKRMVVRQLNRLFPDAEEAYDVIDVGKVEDGWRFQEVMLTRHKRGRLVNSFRCKELTIIVDVEQDTLEVRLKDGYMTNTGRPDEQIPLGADGHSIFLPEAGIKAWLSRASRSFAIGEKGRLTWKITPS